MGKMSRIVNNNLFFYIVQTRSSNATKTESRSIVLRTGEEVELKSPNETPLHGYECKILDYFKTTLKRKTIA